MAEVLTLLMKELRQAQGERELLKKRVEGLTLENRDIGGKWQVGFELGVGLGWRCKGADGAGRQSISME